MKIINFGNYVVRVSSIEMYEIIDLESDNSNFKDKRAIMLYLKNGKVLSSYIEGDDELLEITDELNEAMKEKE